MNKITRQLFDHYTQYGWEQCNMFITQATKELYKPYWAYLSGGPSLPPIGRTVEGLVLML